MPPLSVALAFSVQSGYNGIVRRFESGIAISISRGASGVALGDLSELARRLETVGSEALFVSADRDLEPITAISSLARHSAIVLGAVVSTATRRSAAIVAKRATTFALLAPRRAVLVFRDEDAVADPLVLEESVGVASTLSGAGPLDFAGTTVRLLGAFNEPRPDPADALVIGAWTARPTAALYDRADLVISGSHPTPARDVRADGVRALGAGDLDALESGWLPTLVEVAGGDLDEIVEVAARTAGLARAHLDADARDYGSEPPSSSAW